MHAFLARVQADSTATYKVLLEELIEILSSSSTELDFSLMLRHQKVLLLFPSERTSVNVSFQCYLSLLRIIKLDDENQTVETTMKAIVEMLS